MKKLSLLLFIPVALCDAMLARFKPVARPAFNAARTISSFNYGDKKGFGVGKNNNPQPVVGEVNKPSTTKPVQSARKLTANQKTKLKTFVNEAKELNSQITAAKDEIKACQADYNEFQQEKLNLLVKSISLTQSIEALQTEMQKLKLKTIHN